MYYVKNMQYQLSVNLNKYDILPINEQKAFSDIYSKVIKPIIFIALINKYDI